ncbi:MAG: DUF2064 domain-containing protein [Thermoanaerobaculia bacterium]
MDRSASRCVLLFARTPLQEERVKGLRGGARLFALAKSRLSAALESIPDVSVVIAGEPEDGFFAGATAVAQRGRTFGERFENAFEDARALGFTHIVAVPIDVPSLGAEQIVTSFEKLAANDVVLGPSPDGGVYLIGVRGDTRSLFRGVPWQTARVFLALLRNAGEAVVLASLLDVDRLADLEALASDPSIDIDPELKALVEGLLRLRLGDFPLCDGSRLRSRPTSPCGSRAPPVLLLSF